MALQMVTVPARAAASSPDTPRVESGRNDTGSKKESSMRL